MKLFLNGNARITRLVILELGAGMLLMAIMQIQGNLISQDWLSQKTLKKVSFILAVVGTLIKCSEMFFSKTASLFREHPEPPPGLVETETKIKITETVTPKEP